MKKIQQIITVCDLVDTLGRYLPTKKCFIIWHTSTQLSWVTGPCGCCGKLNVFIQRTKQRFRKLPFLCNLKWQPGVNSTLLCYFPWMSFS